MTVSIPTQTEQELGGAGSLLVRQRREHVAAHGGRPDGEPGALATFAGLVEQAPALRRGEDPSTARRASL